MMKLCFFPHNAEMSHNRLFLRADDPDHRSWAMAAFAERMAEQGILCETDDRSDPAQADAFICHRLDLVAGRMAQALKRNPKAMLFLLALEEPVVCALHEESVLPRLDLDRIFCWRDDLAGFGPVVKCHIPQPPLDETSPDVPFAERKLIIAIDGNKTSPHAREMYSERRRYLKELSQSGYAVDLYGRGWSRCQDPVLRSLWRGEVDAKIAVQSGYRFTLCIQNACDYPGDICEKIFDAFKSGAIPVYRGASNIAEHVPPDCFIDLREFPTGAELGRYLAAMTEAEYQAIRAHILAFMKTGFEARFTGQALADVIAREMHALAGQPRFRRCWLWWCGIAGHLLWDSLPWPSRLQLASLKYIAGSLAR